MINEDKENGMHNPDLTLLQRIAGIIMRPQTTLAAVVEKPTIFKPVIVISIINLILYLITIPKLKIYTQATLEAMSDQMPPEQLAQAKSFMSVGLVVGGGISTIAMPLLGFLIVTLLFKLINLFIGNEAPFKHLYAISVISYIPVILGSALRTLLIAISPAEKIASVSTSAALFLPRGSTGPLFAFFSHIDPFIIWFLILLAMGGAMVLKTSIKKTGIFLFILWFLWAGIGTGLTALSSQQVPGI